MAGTFAANGERQIIIEKPESVGLCSQRLTRIATFMENLVDGGSIPHAMTCIGRHGQICYLHQCGLQNDGSEESLSDDSQIPLRENSIFRLYSMTKPITSVALMMLYEEGAFLLSDPIHLYLGDDWRKDNLRLQDGAPCTTSITMLHLLTHTSGISYRGNTIFNADGMIGCNTQEFTARLSEMPLLFQPGTAWHYGFNTDLCGRLIEVLSRQTLGNFFAERIFGPLNMKDTGFWVEPHKRGRLTDCYRESAEGAVHNCSSEPAQISSFVPDEPRVFQGGGGGLVSTIYDYARFCMMLCNGGELAGTRLLSRKAVEWW
jgi:CubicO group peptidase (beta-lactamase class C family)